jgi:hypothetical protein
MQKVVARITTFCPRSTGYGWELQKVHDHYHIVLDLLCFHQCSVWDAGTGKWLLKTFFKELAATCQECNSDKFMMQIANRIQERHLLLKLLRSIDEKADYQAIIKKRRKTEEEAMRPEEHLFPVDFMITLWCSPGYTQCSFQWNGKNKWVQVHPLIHHWFAGNWKEDNLGMHADSDKLQCHTEYCHMGPGFK